MKKGRAQLCRYPDEDGDANGHKSGVKRKRDSEPQVRGPLSPVSREAISNVGGSNDYHVSFSCEHEENDEQARPSAYDTRESSPQCSQRPTMLLSSRGEQGLSYHFVCHIALESRVV